jgi:hypothetical protein
MSMSILVTDLEIRLLKGVRVRASEVIRSSGVGDDDDASKFDTLLKDLVDDGGGVSIAKRDSNSRVDDNCLMLSYRLFDSISNNQISWLDEMNLSERQR